jgi:glyceraldehyde 3-phosphate dehydrogenase
MVSAGLNGFGRFGLHLLKYWLDRSKDANFRIQYINDDTLGIDDIHDMVVNDPYVTFNKYKVQVATDRLAILKPDGDKYEILVTHEPYEHVRWLGEPEIIFECSGKNTVASRCRCYLTGETRWVLISATSWDAPLTLIYGFNHEAFDQTREQIFSYGSCTVNGFVPFANELNDLFGIVNADVNVVHNVQSYRLTNTLIRKFCTLEASAPALLKFLSAENNFKVTYTVVPYTGVSAIDFRFRLASPTNREDILEKLSRSMLSGRLKNLYQFDEVDIGPERYCCTTFSIVFIKENLKLIGDNLYLQGYFDTENSVNRYYDLASYMIRTAPASQSPVRID